jgi:hypothetical protein
MWLYLLISLIFSASASGAPRTVDRRNQARANAIGTTVELDCTFIMRSLLYDISHSASVDGTFHGDLHNDAGHISFLGVRYADAPVGILRWKAPVSPPTTQLGDVNASSVRFFDQLQLDSFLIVPPVC